MAFAANYFDCYNKCIRVDLPIVTVSINDVPEEACKGVEILAFAAAVLVDYIVSHQKEFDHYNKFANRDRIKTVLNNNISVLKEKLCSKEIVFQKPDGAYIKNVESLQNNCPYAVLETAVSIAEEYRQKNNAYFGSRKTLPKPDIPTLDDCKSFKVRSMADLLRTKRIGLPFIVNGRLCVKKIELTLIENELLNCKNININDSYIVARNNKVMLEVYPIKFITKPFYYSLHDIVVMGVDLGTINDATCAVYNNQTGEVMYRQIQIPEKEVILSYQDEFVKASDNDRKMIIKKRIDALKSAYWQNLAKEICGYAMESKAEYVFFEGLYDQKCTSSAMTLWNPKAALNKIYPVLHNVGIAYQSISPVYTSQYYAKGGVVNRIANDRSKAFTPDGLLVDADKNAALNIVARGMIDMYFDTLPEECLLSIVRDNPRLLRCNEIIFEDLLNTRQLVNNEINTNTVFTRQRYFNKHKATFCKKYRLR